MGGVGVNDSVHILAHTHTHPYYCVQAWEGPVGVGWCACDMTNIINHVHAHLAGWGGVGCVSVYYVEWFGHYRTCGEESTVTA